MARERMDTALYHAIRDQSLQLHYQPIVSLRTGTITGFEVLARWRWRDEEIPPRQFIPIAEQRGLIVPLGEYILGMACQQLHQWQTEGLASQQQFIGINISNRQLNQFGFADKVRKTLWHYSLAGSNLHLEINPGITLRDSATISTNLRLLKLEGIVCAIDHFHNDDISATAVDRLSADILKFDWRLLNTNQAIEEATSTHILRRIIAFAHHLGIAVTAGGVEDEQYLQQILGTGCEYAQGYYFSPPVDATRAGRILAGDPRWERVLH